MAKKDYKKTSKEVFQEHISNELEYTDFEELYNYIKKAYSDKINNNEIKIKVEKARLECYLNETKITSVPNYIYFCVLGLTVFINGVITACIQREDIHIAVAIIVIFVIGIFGIGVLSSLSFVKEDKKVIVSKLCLRILDDIENGEEDKIEIENKLDSILVNTKQIKEFLGIK